MSLTRLEWLDPPDHDALRHAHRHLYFLYALDADGTLTADGRAMARLPIEPSLGRMLLRAAQLRVAPPAASICAMACGDDPYCRAGHPELVAAAAATRARLECNEGDHMSLLDLYDEWRAVPPASRAAWCAEHGVRARVLPAAQDVQVQLLRLLRDAGAPLELDPTLSPVDVSARCREALADAYWWHGARRMRGTSLYQTLTPPVQTLGLSHHASHASAATTDAVHTTANALPQSRRLRTVSHIVFSELAWAGRPLIVRASAVEGAWLERHQHLADTLDEERLLGRRPSKRARPSPHPPAAGGTAADDERTTRDARRNGASDVAAARERYEQRRQQRTQHQRTIKIKTQNVNKTNEELVACVAVGLNCRV